MEHVYFMAEAYALAERALAAGEAPVGCVVAYQNKIVGRGMNCRNAKKNALFHAELLAINEASVFFNDWRLEGATLYVTVEPCPMCAGAILQARISELVYGAENKKAGCCGSVVDLFAETKFNHRVKVTGGIMKQECALLMSGFFSGLRDKRKDARDDLLIDGAGE